MLLISREHAIVKTGSWRLLLIFRHSGGSEISADRRILRARAPIGASLTAPIIPVSPPAADKVGARSLRKFENY